MNSKRQLEIVAIQWKEGVERSPGVIFTEGSILNLTNERLFDCILFQDSLKIAKPLSEVSFFYIFILLCIFHHLRLSLTNHIMFLL